MLHVSSFFSDSDFVVFVTCCFLNRLFSFRRSRAQRDSFLRSGDSLASQSPYSSEDERKADTKERRSDKRGRGDRASSKRRDRYVSIIV